jgi:hypothetical protein
MTIVAASLTSTTIPNNVNINNNNNSFNYQPPSPTSSSSSSCLSVPLKKRDITAAMDMSSKQNTSEDFEDFRAGSSSPAASGGASSSTSDNDNNSKTPAVARTSGFMITDILSSAHHNAAQHLYGHPAAMAAALQSRLGGLPLPPDFGSLQSLHHHHQSLQQLSQQLQQQHQQQQQQHLDASSDDGDNMSDDESAEGGKKIFFLKQLFVFKK